MEMMVAVEMIEAKPGLTERRQLRAGLGLRLRLRPPAEKDFGADPDGIVGEAAVGSDELRDLLRGQCGPAIEQHQVQSDGELGQAARALDRVRSGGGRD